MPESSYVQGIPEPEALILHDEDGKSSWRQRCLPRLLKGEGQERRAHNIDHRALPVSDTQQMCIE